jgi:type II secretory pathway component GspD/PulD (secretin)
VGEDGKMMKKILSCFGLSAVLGMFLFTNAWAEEPKVITIEALAIEMPQNVLNEFVSPGSSETKGFIPPDRIDAGKIVQSFDSLMNEKKISLAQNPRVSAYDGTKAILNMTYDVLYLEKIDKDTFKLKKLTGKEGAGTFFEATPTITKDGKINVQYKLVIQKVIERAPIEGAEGLDIGYPLLSSRSTSSNAVLSEGQPTVVNAGSVGGQYLLIILTAKTKQTQ